MRVLSLVVILVAATVSAATASCGPETDPDLGSEFPKGEGGSGTGGGGGSAGGNFGGSLLCSGDPTHCFPAKAGVGKNGGTCCENFYYYADCVGGSWKCSPGGLLAESCEGFGNGCLAACPQCDGMPVYLEVRVAGQGSQVPDGLKLTTSGAADMAGCECASDPSVPCAQCKSGNFSFWNTVGGDYTITASAPGYAETTVQDSAAVDPCNIPVTEQVTIALKPTEPGDVVMSASPKLKGCGG